MSGRRVSWYSCGAASAVATKLIAPDVIAYNVTGSEDVDNARFYNDCEKWFGKKITRVESDRFKDTWDVWESRQYLRSQSGAPCTQELKIKPRLQFQRPDDIHIFGYTADRGDVKRADGFRDHWPELNVEFPLIERGVTKAACLAMIESAGLRLPRVYSMGFPNANCIPCVKASSPDYWSMIRCHFPKEFQRMNGVCKSLDYKVCRVHGEWIHLDELPDDWPMAAPIAPECDFLCGLAEGDLGSG